MSLTINETESTAQTLTARPRKLDKPCRSYRKNRLGASAVEFAIVAPIFILLVFGMIEFGRMVMVQQLITNASREGARQAVLNGTTIGEVRTTVVNYLANANITVNANDVAVTPDPASAGNGDPITVTLTVPYSDVSWLPTPHFLGSTDMTASTVMRRETGS